MNSIALVGFLACVSFANAGVVPLASSLNSTAEEIREVLANFDPARISDGSINVLDLITISLKSASLSGFSDFVFPTISDDGESVQATFHIPKLSVNVDSLLLSISSGLSAGVSSLDASVSGVHLDIHASYSSSPLRLESLSVLLQLSDVSVSGSVELNGADISIAVDSDIVDTINNALSEAESEVSAVILRVTNKILSLIYPS